jgi:CheY-like chemotaxis protein
MRAIDTQIHFVVNIDSRIPNELIGDELRIRQILLNLLNNAVKYTETGFVALSISAETIDANTIKLIVEVKDSGIGIKPKNIKTLFDYYTQFDLGKNRDIEGTGLGLAIAKNIINAMDGEINVQSEYGQGSTFTVSIPQKINSPKILASVEDPKKKSLIVYESRKIYAYSIIYNIHNLGIDYTHVKNDTELLENMSNREYDFIFISYDLFKKNEDTILKYGAKTKTIVFVELGETIPDKNLNVITMPVYSVSIANVLNGVSEKFSYSDSNEHIVRFTAPDAKVLIVDDINTNLKVAKGLLLPYNIEVELCNSGIKAINLLKSTNYDLVFMDHKMPGMDGVETTQHIRSMGKENAYLNDLPIIALTANAVAGTKEMFMENGFTDFLSKPIDTILLNAILKKWIPKEKQIGGVEP